MKTLSLVRPLFSSRQAVLPLAISALCSANLSAETAQPPLNSTAMTALNNVVVTATRTPQDADTAPAQITVITRADIEAAGNLNLTELLQRKAQVEIRATGGAGQPSGVFIRGANSQHTLVLVDGLRLGSSTAGGAAFENIPLDLIERIEVVKGPLSGVYGADAIGGVIQIFTRNADKPRLTLSLSLGSNAERAVSAGFTTTEDKTTFTINTGYREVNARSASNPQAGSFTYNPDRDPYSNANVSLKLSQKLWQGETISILAWQSIGRAKYDDGVPGDPSSKQILSGVQLVSENQLFPNWQSNFRIGQTTDDIRITSSFPGTFKSAQSQVIWVNEFKTADGVVNIGGERREEKVTSTTDYDIKKRTTSAVFASYLERLDENQLELTIRRDEEKQFGQRNTGSIAYGLQLTRQTLLYAREGRAFRAPSFNDLYFPGFSNSLLLPERSEQKEGGFKYANKETRVSIAYFDNKIDDLIFFDFATSKPQNIRHARIKGWELNSAISLFGFNVNAALTLQQPIDVDNGLLLRSRAKQFGNLGVSKVFGVWTFTSDLTGSSARYESAGAKMGGYALLGANVRYQVDKIWVLDISAANLGNRNYVLARGYNQPLRSILMTMRAVAF